MIQEMNQLIGVLYQLGWKGYLSWLDGVDNKKFDHSDKLDKYWDNLHLEGFKSPINYEKL